MKITPFFRWYDIWVGVFIDTKKRTAYICPLPMIGLKIELIRRKPDIASRNSICQQQLDTQPQPSPAITARVTRRRDDIYPSSTSAVV